MGLPPVVDLTTLRDWHRHAAELAEGRRDGALWTAQHNTGMASGLARRRVPTIEREIRFHTDAAALLEPLAERADA